MRNLMLAAAMTSMAVGSPADKGESQKDDGKVALKLRRGYEHKGKTPERLEKRRQNRQRLKAKRNAKKGIYKHKLVYNKKR